MKALLIVNPASGGNNAPDQLPEINARLRQRFSELDIVMTAGSGDAARAAHRAAHEAYPFVFVAGGDGTLNEAINGLLRASAATCPTLGILPLGTGNDFARALGIPEDLASAVEVALAEQTVAVDVGELDGRYFINVSAGGFIAEVSEATTPELKTIAGKLAYLIGGAQVLAEYEPVRASLHCVADQPECADLDLRLQFFAVCNSRMIGGGRLIAPHAVIDDGWFDVCLAGDMPTLEFIRLLAKVSGGDHLDDPRVRYFRARELRMEFERAVKVNTDGEVLEAGACSYRIHHRALRFLAGDTPLARQVPAPSAATE